MAATLTDSGELTFVSFPIEKTETTADGDLVVYGKASDGAIDHDMQIVDPTFTSAGIKKWLDTGGNLRVQHNAQRDPAGIGLEAHTDADGATWVKSLVIEPVAQKLVSKGALRAYSVGIARPTIVRDAVAKGGRITAGEIVEISLVDRPANARCGIQLVKSADDGSPEYVGKVFGGDDAIAKALDGDVVEKSAPAEVPEVARFGFSEDLSVSFTPNDMMRLMQQKFVSQHYDELALKAVTEAEAAVYKRDIDTATRRRLAADGKALPNLSYPIENAGDLDNAAHLARSGHGDVAAARRLIARRARELGVANPLDESDDVSKSEVVEAAVEAPAEPAAEKAEDGPEAVKEAEPDVTKDPEPEQKPKPVKKAKKKPKKMPPWLKGDDDSKGSDDDKDDDDSSCKSAHVWEIADPVAGSVVCAKCHTSPAAAAGVTASQMDPAPVGELLESSPPVSVKGATPASASGAVAERMNPVPRHREPDGAPMEAFEASADMSDGDDEQPTRLEAATGMKAATTGADLAPDPEVAALLRFKAIGADEDLGRLHDLTCPAFHPDTVAKYHPYADLDSLIDSRAWQRKTLAAAAGPLQASLEAQEAWQAAFLLKTADPADVNQWRLELHKAFRDANPGPGSFPTPGCVTPGSYNRPVLTDGRSANAADYDGPNSSPQVATSAPNAHDFDRPPLSAAQQSPSPSFMKGGFEYPAEQGVPVQLPYAAMQKEQQRQALVRMHHHLSRQFPEMCPITFDAGPVQAEDHPVPVPAGIGKAIDPEPAPAQEASAAFKATPEDGDLFTDAEVFKSFKKMRKKLGKKVLAGKMTVDEARAHLGRQFTQKGTEEPQEAVQKAAAPREVAVAAPLIAAALDPEVIKAAVAEATAPLEALLTKQQETFETKLAEQQKVIDAIADQPDPSTAAFSGLAFQPNVMKSRRPAAVPDQAEYAARAQAMIRRNLQHTYESHSDPHVREAASSALANLGVGADAPPMT